MLYRSDLMISCPCSGSDLETQIGSHSGQQVWELALTLYGTAQFMLSNALCK